MNTMTPEALELSFQRIVAAAIANERCPVSHPHGPLASEAVTMLVEAGRIRSEVYSHNFRRVTILKGEHAGKSTASPPHNRPPYMINGRHVDRGRHSPRSPRPIAAGILVGRAPIRKIAP